MASITCRAVHLCNWGVNRDDPGRSWQHVAVDDWGLEVPAILFLGDLDQIRVVSSRGDCPCVIGRVLRFLDPILGPIICASKSNCPPMQHNGTRENQIGSVDVHFSGRLGRNRVACHAGDRTLQCRHGEGSRLVLPSRLQLLADRPHSRHDGGCKTKIIWPFQPMLQRLWLAARPFVSRYLDMRNSRCTNLAYRRSKIVGPSWPIGRLPSPPAWAGRSAGLPSSFIDSAEEALAYKVRYEERVNFNMFRGPF